MFWTFLAVAVAIAVLLGLTIAVALSAREIRRTREVMEAFAARYGLPFSAGKGPAEMTISGEVEGRPLTIATRDTHRPSSELRAAPVAPHTSFRAPVDLGPLRDLSFRPDHLGAVDRGLTLGRPDIDDPYIFDGRPQHLVLAYLNRERVGTALQRLAEAAPGVRMVRAELDAEREGYPVDITELEAIADPLVACAETLSEEAAAFDPNAIETGLPSNLEDFGDERRKLVEAWAEVADEHDLAFVAAEPTGDLAVGGTLEARELSVGTRGSAERDTEPHALVELEAGGETRPTLVVKPTDTDWRLIGLHDEPVPVDAEQREVDRDLFEDFTVFADDRGAESLLDDPAVLEDVEALVDDDHVVDIDDGLLRIEVRRAPRTRSTLTDMIERSTALARHIDAATAPSEDA